METYRSHHTRFHYHNQAGVFWLQVLENKKLRTCTRTDKDFRKHGSMTVKERVRKLAFSNKKKTMNSISFYVKVWGAEENVLIQFLFRSTKFMKWNSLKARLLCWFLFLHGMELFANSKGSPTSEGYGLERDSLLPQPENNNTCQNIRVLVLYVSVDVVRSESDTPNFIITNQLQLNQTLKSAHGCHFLLLSLWEPLGNIR